MQQKPIEVSIYYIFIIYKINKLAKIFESVISNDLLGNKFKGGTK